MKTDTSSVSYEKNSTFWNTVSLCEHYYSQFQHRNIFDIRHTGCGKTTAAIEYIHHEVRNGRNVIVVMRSYENLEECKNKLDSDVYERALIFRGKTQPGMCYQGEQRITSLDYIRPINTCTFCPAEEYCEYNKQIAELSNLKDDGVVVFVVKEMLPFVLNLLSWEGITTIIDDVPLADIMMPTYSTSLSNLEEIESFISRHIGSNGAINNAIGLLKNQEKDVIISYIRENQLEIVSQLHEIEEIVSDHLNPSSQSKFQDDEKIPDFKIIYPLIDAVRQDGEIKIYNSLNGPISNVRIVENRLSKLKSIRVFYLNATPGGRDEYCMDQLGDYGDPIRSDAELNDNFTVIHVSDHRYPATGILQSPDAIIGHIEAVNKELIGALECLDESFVLFSHGEVYFSVFQDLETFEGNHMPVKFFGSLVSSTNEFRGVKISIIVGTPSLPPEAFFHPAYDEWMIPVEERESNYPVPRLISNIESKNQIIQMIGRIMRKDERNPEAKKICIVFSDIDLADGEYMPQNGAKIERHSIRSAAGRDTLLSRMHRLSREALEESIIEKMFSEIDLELELGKRILLNQYAEKVANQVKLISASKIKGILSNQYKVERIPHGKFNRQTHFITEKLSS